MKQKEEALRTIEGDLAWAFEQADLLRAEGISDVSVELRQIAKKYGPDLVDELLAAQASDRLLLTEDLGYRLLGSEQFGLRTSWLQPILMVALKRQLITAAEYNGAIIKMIRSRCSFISISNDVLTGYLAGATSLPLPADFRSAVATLGGPDAEIHSHIAVAAETLADIWNSNVLPHIVRSAATGAILERLTLVPKYPATDIVATIAHETLGKLSYFQEFEDYVSHWLVGHFFVAAGHVDVT